MQVKKQESLNLRFWGKDVVQAQKVKLGPKL
jgi:hypothetical protein